MVKLDDIGGLGQGGMRIEDFATGSKLSVGKAAGGVAMDNAGGKNVSGSSEAASFFAGEYSSRIGNANYNKDSISDESLAEELARKGAGFSGTENAKQSLSMAVAGFSVEDLSGAKEEGYDVGNMESNEIVTVIDNIKKHLAMGGKDISAMGGLSDAEIAAMSGGSANTEVLLSSALKEADLPADDDIIQDGVIALQKAGELSETSDGISPAAMEFLLKNELEPTIENVYQGTFSQGVGTGALMATDEADVEALMPQVERLLDSVDLAADDRQKENVRWMLERGIAITPDNLAYLNTLQTTEADVSDEAVLSDVIDSVSEGKRPQEAYPVPGFSMRDKAQSTVETVQNVSDEQVARVVERGEELTVSNLEREMRREERGLAPLEGEVEEQKLADESTKKSPFSAEQSPALSAEQIRAQRVLEEARLVMTTQANFSLMKQGIAVDTTELSEVVEQLKALEQSFYKSQLAGNDETISEEELLSRIDQFETTTTQLNELQDMPAALLGRIPDVAEATISDLHRTGRSLQRTLEEAGERYETMRTEIRRDLGDSRAKAFGNIDDLLEELDMEATAANRRAVRILGYNEQEITTESVANVKANDELVQRTFKSLTPGVVATMIREGENPLNLSMEELNDKAEEIKAASPSASEEGRFAEFLYKAERAGELSEEERDAFVGMYRLIYQVEKTDGAVIGQLMAQGADITLNNMMMAVRTRRQEHREYTIDDDFGFAEFDKSVLSITEQIEMAFQTRRMKDAGDVLTPQKLAAFDDEETYLSMSPDRFAEALSEMPESQAEMRQEEEYEKQYARQLKEAAQAEERVYDFLSRFDLPQSPANLEAFSQMLNNRNEMYRRLFPNNGREVFGTEADGVAEGEIDLSDVMEDIIREFGESVQTPEEMAEAQQHLQEIAENVMRTMIVEQPVGTINVRGMQIAIKQIKSMGEVSRRTETYSMPILVEDSVGNLSLRIIRAPEEERGQVQVSFESERVGVVDASFRYETDGVYGSITTSLSATRERIENVIEEISTAMETAAGQPVQMTFDVDGRADANRIFEEPDVDFEPRTDGERPEVQTRALYGIARSFIDAMGKI